MDLKLCGLFALMCVVGAAYGGYSGVVDDEIWNRVLKVLSKGYGGSKIVLSHPEPAYLVDSYSKVYNHAPAYHHHHEPYYHEPHHHHHDHHDHGHHHHHSYGPPDVGYGPPAHYHGHGHGNHLGHY